jgi:low affinity Fe/Cu permease
MAMGALQRALTLLGTMTARPWAFLVVLAYAAFWLSFERETFDLHAVATLVVWVMTLLIQRAEHRDTQAIHAKLDELLRAEDAARSDLARIDEEEPEAIERSRAEAQKSENAD